MNVFADTNLITARGKAVMEFALAVAEAAGVLGVEAAYQAEFSWLKNLV